MIIGLGIDLIEISRFEGILARWGERFTAKFFTTQEAGLGARLKRDAEFYAGSFAVKEAFSKAVGTGFRGGMRFQHVEVLRTGLGKPYIVLHGAARELAEALGVGSIHTSISHNGTHAVAVVVLESRD